MERKKAKAAGPAFSAQASAAPSSGSLFGSSSSTAAQPVQKQNTASFNSHSDQSFALDFSTVDKNDVLENFDFDSFLDTSNDDAFNFESGMVGMDDGSNEEFSAKKSINYSYSPASPAYSPVSPVHSPAALSVAPSITATPAHSNTANDTQDLAAISDADKMHKLIEMQRFDGSWAATEALWKLLVVYAEVVRAKDAGLAGVEEAVLATVAAVAWLQVKMGGEEEVWEMVVEKAKAWMQGKGVDEGVVEGVKALF